MKTESFIRVLAGTFILVTLALGYWITPVWLLGTAFVALNLIQSAFTGFCPPILLLRRIGRIDAQDRIHFTSVPRPQ